MSYDGKLMRRAMVRFEEAKQRRADALHVVPVFNARCVRKNEAERILFRKQFQKREQHERALQNAGVRHIEFLFALCEALVQQNI